MARRPRTLYEFVDPEDLDEDAPPSADDAPASIPGELRGRTAPRVGAGLALCAGVLLVAVGASHFRRHDSSPTTGGATPAIGTGRAPRVAPPDRVRHPVRRSRARRHAQHPKVKLQGPHIAPHAQPVAITPHWRAPTVRIRSPRVTPSPRRTPPVSSQAPLEFGFER